MVAQTVLTTADVGIVVGKIVLYGFLGIGALGVLFVLYDSVADTVAGEIALALLLLVVVATVIVGALSGHI